MTEVLDAPEKTVTIDSFDGSLTPPEERVAPIEEEKKQEAPIVEEKKVEPVIEEKAVIENKEEPVIEEKKKEEPQPQKYANEKSEKIHKLLLAGENDKVLDILNEQRKIEKLVSGDINKETAKDILKLSLEKKFEGLKPEQIEYKFNKMYGVPKEPVQRQLEDNDDFEERHSEWEQKAKDAENDLLIDAEIAKHEIAKYKEEIQLPDIADNFIAKEQTPEELEAEKNEAIDFLQKAGDAISKFEGFNVSYKDKDVDIQSNYALSDEEKNSISGKLKTLAERNYNANALFAERWVNDDNTYNFQQIIKDLAILETEDKRSQKFVSDTVTKATLQFIKGKHNIDLGKQAGGDLQLEDKTTQQKSEDAIWGIG